MIVITGTAQKSAWDRDVFPPVEQVRPGLWSIPVPIPGSGLRYVLVYLLELDDGVAIVDAGWNTDDAYNALTAGIAQAGGSVSDVKAILVTHIHPDHYGLAGRVREASGAWIGLHPDDADLLGSRYVEPSGLLGQMSEILADAGVPEETVNRLASSSMPVRDIVTPAFPDVLFEDGKRVDLNGWDLRAVWTPGHSPGHVCFYSEDHRLLLSGDHILPRITSNIAVHAQQPTNPLAEYFDSLAKVRPLDVEEVLPAHEYRFAGLPARIDEILAHHHDRLGEIEQHLRKVPGATAWDITEQLTWSRTWENMADFVRRAALGEAQAHLVLLETQGRVRLEGRRPVRYYLADDGS